MSVLAAEFIRTICLPGTEEHYQRKVKYAGDARLALPTIIHRQPGWLADNLAQGVD
jgi:hypothetical protein